jgi:kynurenine 3-monooxygenase
MADAPDHAPLVVVGGGLVGPVVALFLARRFGRVELFERRPPPSEVPFDEGRSVNVVISARGWRSLDALGLSDRVRTIAMPLSGRHVHDPTGNITFQPYGRRGETIWAVERPRLNALLLEAAQREPNLNVHYGWTLTGVATDGPRLDLVSRTDAQRTLTADHVIACDGVQSVISTAIGGKRELDRLAIGYKEIRIAALPGGGFRFDRTCFQTWPRPGVLVTAFPNPDGTFTGSLFLAHEGDGPTFDSVKEAGAARTLLERTHPALAMVVPDIGEQVANHPTGTLTTLLVEKWVHGGTLALAGDAAHAVVPFMGQGMNCGFEDARVLDECLAAHADWAEAFAAYASARKPNADALAAISLAHFRNLAAPLDPTHPRVRVTSRLYDLAPSRFAPLYERCAFGGEPFAEIWAAQKELERTVATLEPDADSWLALPDDHALAALPG